MVTTYLIHYISGEGNDYFHIFFFTMYHIHLMNLYNCATITKNSFSALVMAATSEQSEDINKRMKKNAVNCAHVRAVRLSHAKHTCPITHNFHN